jgi:hypothetical protein
MVPASFIVIAAALLALVVYAARSTLAASAYKRFFLMVAAWVAICTVASVSGVLARFELRPAPVILLGAASLMLAVGLAFSSVGHAFSTLPLSALVGFHAFRLPLELAMHEAANTGLMPVQMTWTGLNFDVVTGASAIVVAMLLRTGTVGRRVTLAWNVAGTVLLGVIVVISIRSTPVFHAFGEAPEQLNTFITRPPYTSLPAVMVLLALAGHLVIFRRLVRMNREPSHQQPSSITRSDV